MSFITSIGTATPSNKLAQSDIASFMVKAMRLDADEERKLRVLFRSTGIETRYSVLEDYGRTDGFHFYENNPSLEPFPSTRKRMELFRKHALSLSVDAIHDCLKSRHDLRRDSITHLIVVSCTGMYAPGLDIDIVKSVGLSFSVQRICINFMGCYAAFNAVRMADSFCRQPGARVLVVCTELCSIHFQREHSEDNLLANALFGDGSAALLIEPSPVKGINLHPESFYSELATEGEHDMTWTIGDFGFEMRLSSYVPEIIRAGIRKLTLSLLDQLHLNISQVDFFAIHPGGRKILEAIEQELGLTREQNRYAYEVLRNYGNMSSPTVLFVLNEIFTHSSASEKQILSFAFGPGLTLESMMLKTELY